MAFESFHFTSTVGSATTFQVYPGWAFSEEIVVNRTINLSLTRQYNSYQLEGDFFRYTVPMTFVSSRDRNEFHTWWRDQRDVVFTINLSSNPESLVCRIANNIEPFGIRSPMQYDKYDGILRIHSIRPSTTPLNNTFPFILDNSSLGLLDQNYNFLDEELPKSGTSGKGKGGPWLLDDVTWGSLDKTYNILL